MIAVDTGMSKCEQFKRVYQTARAANLGLESIKIALQAIDPEIKVFNNGVSFSARKYGKILFEHISLLGFLGKAEKFLEKQ